MNRKNMYKRIHRLKENKFHAKMSSIKDRNGMDLTEAEKILRRDGMNTQKNSTKKIFTTQIITMGSLT